MANGIEIERLGVETIAVCNMRNLADVQAKRLAVS
jgi:hypothetical protein